MSVRKRRQQHGRPERRITVRGIRRDTPDMGKLARALLQMAQRETEAQHDAESRNSAPALEKEQESDDAT